MSPSEIPDRRPLLYIIMGVVIVAIAAVLFWPQGEDETQPDLVLTPESMRQASDLATDVETPAATTEEAVPEDEFTVTDAGLPDDIDAPEAETTTVAKTTPPTAKKTTTSTPAAIASNEPGRSGSYVIYVGSYVDKSNAQRAADELEAKGVRAQVISSGGKHRVAVGYFASSAKAESYAAGLKSKMGLDYWVAKGR